MIVVPDYRGHRIEVATTPAERTRERSARRWVDASGAKAERMTGDSRDVFSCLPDTVDP